MVSEKFVKLYLNSGSLVSYSFVVGNKSLETTDRFWGSLYFAEAGHSLRSKNNTVFLVCDLLTATVRRL